MRGGGGGAGDRHIAHVYIIHTYFTDCCYFCVGSLCMYVCIFIETNNRGIKGIDIRHLGGYYPYCLPHSLRSNGTDAGGVQPTPLITQSRTTGGE